MNQREERGEEVRGRSYLEEFVHVKSYIMVSELRLKGFVVGIVDVLEDEAMRFGLVIANHICMKR